MITNITLENFKCFRKVEVNPRRITVFVGPNGTGKSSVLQAMALLKQSVGSNALRYQGRLLNLVGPQDMAPKFQGVLIPTRIEFRGTYVHLYPPDLGFDQEALYRYTSEFLNNGRLGSHSGQITFGFGGENTTIEVADDTEFPKHVEFGEYSATLGQGNMQIPMLVTLDGWPRPPDISLQNSFQGIIHSVNSVLAALRFVPAVRGLVRPTYQLMSEKYEDVSLAGGLSSQEDQSASNLGYSRSLEGAVSGWLRRVTGTGLRADTVPPQSVEIKALAPVGDVNIVTEGFGTNALILLLLQLVEAGKDATVMIEEPEIHLHPKAQAELASLLVEEAQAEDKQIIMTTHSEHILNRLLTLVAENKLSVDELAIYAFEKDEKGECSASQIKVFEDGRVQGGIKDFFDTNLLEMNRYVQAQFSRLQPEE